MKTSYDKEEISDLVNKGYLSIAKSNDPDYFGLSIYKYTKKVHSDNLWNDTLIHCRGIVLDDKGNVISRPFKKFFNEFELPKEYVSDLFKNDYEIHEKLDGSLGVLFYYKGKWLNSSAGSFMSEQAIWFRNKLKEYDLSSLDTKCTYVFELIYPENKIVVSYKKEMLVLLGEIRTDTGRISEYFRLSLLCDFVGFTKPKIYNKAEMDSIIKDNVRNFEGFVLKFSNNEQIKIKLENYVFRHRILTNLTPKVIVENYLLDRCKTLYNTIDEEDLDFVKSWVLAINNYKKCILGKNLNFCSSVDKSFERKYIALSYQKENDEDLFLNLIFNILDKDKIKIEKCLDAILSKRDFYKDEDFLKTFGIVKNSFLEKFKKIFKKKYI